MSYLPCELCCLVRENNDVTDVLKAAADDHLAAVALVGAEGNSDILPTVRTEIFRFGGCGVTALGAHATLDGTANADETVSAIKAYGGVAGVFLCDGDGEQAVRNWRNVDFLRIWQGAFSFYNTYNDKAFALWNSLLDKGYHIACTYARDTDNEPDTDAHYGCTYVDIDGEVSEQSVLRGVRMGKTVASTGAKFFFRVHQKGNTYSIGETMKKGNAVFSFFTDLHSREKNAGKEEIEYKIIKVITNGGEEALIADAKERHIYLNLKKNHWYRAELWGTVDGVNKILAVTSPIYTA
ncbi:CehA/McbA family metallohydrolase [uncultured Eubacterium sp.]|uniref:CehA/McbA family metallohydrolase n=1 Tax=uncultured Eubacterium sp. TaxID=165185 RepID=UPI0025DF192F|nr:CehA/McbA family metallohydrolase [uncultured Eubacterium sp.]